MTEDLDHVALIQQQWKRERPDLDTSAMGIIGRLHRLADALNAELRPVFEEAGLSDGEFDVLASLRRAGDPYALTPGQLAETTMITSGTVTKRVDRLVSAGLVTRERVDHDGRVRRIVLLPAGRRLVDEVATRHFANEDRLLGGFSEMERTRLAHLLNRWTTALGV